MKKSSFLALCAVAILSACGGGGDGQETVPAPTLEVPQSASQSVAGLMGYMKDLVASMADTLEPVDVSAVTPPADDAVDPAKVD